MSMPTKAQVELTVRVKAFTGQAVKQHRVMVDDLNVRVYDPIAGYFTVCHCLTPRQVRRIIAKAAS